LAILIRSKSLTPVRPNVGVAAAYQRRVGALIEEMHASLVWWLRAALRKREPEIVSLMAADDSPAREIGAIMRRLARRWQQRFNAAAPELASYFATAAADRSDATLQSILKRGGIAVKFKPTRAVNDVLQATIQENVALIRSIAQQHLTQVEGMVMRSVQHGRDLQSLAEGLQNQLGVSKRRARLIARDQNNKATAVIQRVRQAEIGITQAQWLHSGGGREPRPTHLKAGRDKVVYNIAEGWFDPAIQKYIWPGTEINCRCVAKPIVQGFS
jgi:SPP1 gp7 family putative phage head morphogenesis protein